MPLEPQSGAPTGPQVENPTTIISPAERSLMDLWRVLMKRRLTIVAVTLLSLAAAAWDAFRTPPVYETVSRVEIKPNQVATGEMALMGEDDPAALQTEMQVIQSDTVLFQAAQSINLVSQLRQNNGKNGAKQSESSGPVTPPERRAMIGMMKRGLSITILPGTRILEIHYRGTDPWLAADIVNGLVDTYSDQGLRVSFERTAHVSDWLEKQLDTLKQDAADSQRQLADYQRAHNIVGTDQNSNLTLQTLQKVSTELDDAEADLIMKDAKAVDGSSLKDLKEHLYQGTITADQYASLIAPMKEKYGLIFQFENIHWLYWCQILFVFTLALMIIISLLTKAPDPKTVKYTWYGATPEEKAATKASWNALDVVLSLIVVGTIVLFYIKFW